jgi:riboflavin transporter FmnP
MNARENDSPEPVPTSSMTRTKQITTIALFTAISIALSISPLKFPAPYAPFLFYEIWEIPIVVSFLLFGWQIGMYVSFVNFGVLLIFFQGALSAGPLYNLIAVITMLFGIGLGHRLSKLGGGGRPNFGKTIIMSTSLGAIFRATALTFVNASLLPLGAPLGFSLPFKLVLYYLPFIALFNVSLTAYTVPLAYLGLRAIVTRYRISPVFQISPLLDRRVIASGDPK